MGSIFEINDSLVITREQGFPKELQLDAHMQKPFIATDFTDKVFEFKNKQDIRLYQMPPVRNFLVEKTDQGKWIYWGLVHILSLTHDYESQTTAGKFKVIYINTLAEMKQAHHLIDRDHKTNYFS